MNHRFQVPLDHHRKNSTKIEVFAREVVSLKKKGCDLPWIVYFQGGPGFESHRPKSAGFIELLAEDYRVLLLDQRGTGLSTPFDLSLYTDHKAQELAEYLAFFRADQIVADAEFIRSSLNIEQWSVMGQSYGGFCILSYLSFYPEGIKEALITGGVPPILQGPQEVYQATHRRTLQKNKEYFQRFPQDQELCKKIVKSLLDHRVLLPDGSRLTPARFQQLGSHLIGSQWESLHYLLEMAFPDARFQVPSLKFLFAVHNGTSVFEHNPLYAILHESIYCQKNASQWAAWKVRQNFPEFDACQSETFYFTGEVIYPFMFEEYAKLSPFKEVAHILAEKNDWPALYDIDKLKQCQIPCAAAIYEDDIAVEREFSLQVKHIVPSLKVWCTNEYQHDGLRVDSKRILERLRGMCHGVI